MIIYLDVLNETVRSHHPVSADVAVEHLLAFELVPTTVPRGERTSLAFAISAGITGIYISTKKYFSLDKDNMTFYSFYYVTNKISL